MVQTKIYQNINVWENNQLYVLYFIDKSSKVAIWINKSISKQKII